MSYEFLKFIQRVIKSGSWLLSLTLGFNLVISIVISSVISSCVTKEVVQSNFGIVEGREGYIPARIALVSCQHWPSQAALPEGERVTNQSLGDSKWLCDEIDAFVSAGFDNQPFMKGLSPRLIERLLLASQLAPREGLDGSATDPGIQLFRASIEQHWQKQSSDCFSCNSAPLFYSMSIANRNPWLFWLSEFSKATRGSDAVLIPFLMSHVVDRVDDRGLISARRIAKVVMLLIETNSGKLIWSGSREAMAANKSYPNREGFNALAAPNLESIRLQLLSEALWTEFPGRKIYK
jgi:hypothetical protein